MIGGGIAGLSASVALAERGIRVVLLEAQDQLGGRVRSWPIDGAQDSTAPLRMSRGFHAFFRQYYNLRALLRRVDPALSGLRPVADYPLRHADGTEDSFTDIATQPPWNFLSFVRNSPSFTLPDLLRVDPDRALDLVDVAFPVTYARYDGVSAESLLDALRFPAAMRSLALEVFARSFFADPKEFSAGEVVAMFHTYFLGSAEGLLFDVSRDDFDTTFWTPMRGYLERHDATVRTGCRVTNLQRSAGGFTVLLDDGTPVDVDAVVLAADRAGLQHLVAASPTLGDAAWRRAVAEQRMAPRFIVQRLWFDRPTSSPVAPFVGTAAFGYLDNISAVHLLEDWAIDWAERTGGSIIELHAYAVPDDIPVADVLADLREQLNRLHPEFIGVDAIHDEVLVEADCPLAGTDPWDARPGVVTPDRHLVLAGDGIRCDLPVALMERAATTGFQAANVLLTQWGLEGHELWSVPTSPRFPRTIRAARALLAARARALSAVDRITRLDRRGGDRARMGAPEFRQQGEGESWTTT